MWWGHLVSITERVWWFPEGLTLFHSTGWWAGEGSIAWHSWLDSKHSTKPGAPVKLGSTCKAFHWLTNTILPPPYLWNYLGLGLGLGFCFGLAVFFWVFVLLFGFMLLLVFFWSIFVLCCLSSWTGWFFFLPPTCLGQGGLFLSVLWGRVCRQVLTIENVSGSLMPKMRRGLRPKYFCQEAREQTWSSYSVRGLLNHSLPLLAEELPGVWE